MTQQRDATTYFLFLKSLPHCTRLISDQTFWEFCRETEEQFKFRFITNKPLKTGGQQSALQRGKIAGALGLQPQHRPSILPHFTGKQTALPRSPECAQHVQPRWNHQFHPSKTQVPFPLWSGYLTWWHLSPYLAGKYIPYFKGPVSPCLWRLPQRALVYTGSPLHITQWSSSFSAHINFFFF